MATRNHLSLRIFAWLFPLFFILFQVSPLLAQTETSNDTTPTAEQLKGQIQEFFDEVLDVDVGWDALQIRHISNVGYGIDNAIGLNGELRDTLAFARQVLQSELFVRSLLQYDHFWARTLNRKNYSPKEKEIERKFDEPYNSNLKFDIVFTPAWDTVNMTVDEARTNNLIAYNVQIKTQAHGTIETRIDQEELTTLLNEALKGETYDKIGSKAKPAVNASMFDGVGFVVGNDTVETDDSNIERIEFTLPSRQAYGFDAYDNEILAGNYDKVEINGKVYYIPWKSVAKSGTDSLRARVVRRDEEQAIGDTAQFKTGTGVTQPAQVRSGALTYNITTTPLGVEGMESLLATYTITTKDGSTEEVEAGRVNLVVYEKLIQKVVLVPVNGIDGGIVPTDIKNALDTIYKQAVVEWDVSLSQGITVPEIYDDNQFQDGGTGVFSNYTEEMKKVIKVFDDSYPVDKNTCYLFLLNKPESGSSKLGSMPLKKQFGFIYVDNASGTRLAHTIAHELGHGPFRLYHTFSENNDYYQARGQTNNLMDYKDPTATRLYKYQWDYIHDPQAMISWLQGEEESESINTSQLAAIAAEGGIDLDGQLTILTPAGVPFTLPEGARLLDFIETKSTIFNSGSVKAFIVGEDRYHGIFNTSDKSFYGYSKLINPNATKITEKYAFVDKRPVCLEDNTTPNLPDETKVIIGYPGNCELNLYTIPLETVKSKLSETNTTGRGIMPPDLIFSEKTEMGSVSDPEACVNLRRKNVFVENFRPTGFDLKEVDPEIQKQISERYVEKFAEKFITAAGNYPTSDDDESLYGDNFYHIINADLLQFENSIYNLDIIEHKLQYLKNQTEVSVFVIVGYVPFIFDYNSNLCNEFAQSVFEKAKPNLPERFQKNTVLIVLPFTSLEKYITGVNWQYMMAGLHDPSYRISKKFNDGEYTSTYRYIMGAYKWIQKPYREYVVCLNADGSISYNESDLGLQYGKFTINAVHYYKRPEFDQIRSLSVPQEYYTSTGTYGGGAVVKNPNYAIEKFKYDIQVINLLEHAKTHPKDWQTVEIRLFKERYVTRKNLMMYATKQAFRNSGFFEWCNEVSIAWGSSNELDPNDDYQDLDLYMYGYSRLAAIDPIVYTLIDLAGMIPVIDNFADIAGIAYATARGDFENVAAYTIGLAAVGVGAVAVKYGPELIKVIYKGSIWIFDQSKNLVKVFKKADLYDEAFATIIKVSDPSLLKGKSDYFVKLLDENKLKQSQIDEILSQPDDASKLKKLDEIIEGTAGSADVILTRLRAKEPFKSLSDDDWLKFTNDFNDSPTKLLNFESNQKLLNSWKLVSDLPDGKIWIKQNIDILEKFSELDGPTQLKLKKFYSTFTPNGPYPTIRNGIPINKYGFPEFPEDALAPITNKKYYSELLDGAKNGSKKDYEDAAKWFVENNPNAQLATGGQGIVVNGEYYAMHHMQDGRTIIPVLQSVHNTSHTGGASIIRNELQGIFNIP